MQAENLLKLTHALDKNLYGLKDLGLGSGTFLKCQTGIKSLLRNGQIVIFGENQMVVGITHGKNGKAANGGTTGGAGAEKDKNGDQQDISRQNSSRNDNMIVMRFIEGPKKGQQFEFLSTLAPLMIGRTEQSFNCCQFYKYCNLYKCQVRFNDTSLSRLQCRIDFIDDKWFIKDGDGDKKASTNGTWLFAEEEIKLENESVIKAGLSLFKVTLIM